MNGRWRFGVVLIGWVAGCGGDSADGAEGLATAGGAVAAGGGVGSGGALGPASGGLPGPGPGGPAGAGFMPMPAGGSTGGISFPVGGGAQGGPPGPGGDFVPPPAGGDPAAPAGGDPAAPAGGDPAAPPGGTTCLDPGNGSYEERGPYNVTTRDLSIGSQGMYTLFYPSELESDCLHPIVVWGNGTAVEGSAVYAFFNENAASWGMVVAASHDPNTGSGAFHTEAIDYLLAENDNPDSVFYQKLSTRVGTSGHSQGGLGASLGARHANVQAQVSVGAGGTASAKVSVLVLTGTEDIVSTATSGVRTAAGKMFVASWEGGDHFVTETLAGYIVRDPGSLQMQRLYAAWFRCFLADDSVACDMFTGGAPDGCGICSDPGWAELASANL